MIGLFQSINEKSIVPKYLICKKTNVQFDENDSMDRLWEIHNDALNKKADITPNEGKSLLDLKIHIAKRIFSDCVFCERRCHVDRNKKDGFCQVNRPRIACEFIHYGEEKFFIPSHTIFFSGCNFECRFCQNFDISQNQMGLYIPPERMGTHIQEKYNKGSKNVNWVGGEPTPNVLYILESLNLVSTPIHQIYNSNMYCSTETMLLLHGVIDVFLADFKFGNNSCACHIAGIENYVNIIKRNLKMARSFSELFIRHLVLPNHIDCCSKLLLIWITSNLPNTTVNIMDQFRPEYMAKHDPLLNMQCSKDDIISVKKYTKKLGISLYSD